MLRITITSLHSHNDNPDTDVVTLCCKFYTFISYILDFISWPCEKNKWAKLASWTDKSKFQKNQLMAGVSILRATIYFTYCVEYTLSGHLIGYSTAIQYWERPPFCLPNTPNSSWHGFNKVLDITVKPYHIGTQEQSSTVIHALIKKCS